MAKLLDQQNWGSSPYAMGKSGERGTYEVSMNQHTDIFATGRVRLVNSWCTK